MTKAWDDRAAYGVILNNIIKKQYATYQKSSDTHFKLKLVHSISNLISSQNGLINDRYDSIKSDLTFFAHLELVTPAELRKDIDKLFKDFRTDKEDPKSEKQYKENKKKEVIRNFIRDKAAKKSHSKGQQDRDRRLAWSKNEGLKDGR